MNVRYRLVPVHQSLTGERRAFGEPSAARSGIRALGVLRGPGPATRRLVLAVHVQLPLTDTEGYVRSGSEHPFDCFATRPIGEVLRGSLYGSLKPPETASLCSASLSSGHCSPVADPWASRMASHCWQAASPISSHRGAASRRIVDFRARWTVSCLLSVVQQIWHALRSPSRAGARTGSRGERGSRDAGSRERLAAMFSPSKKLHRLGHLSSWAS